ncbi:MAG: hypothetical protein HYR80_08900 [Nitrospirae bacterium]|nr:hypothetical protein [Nitrospirota bacterium]
MGRIWERKVPITWIGTAGTLTTLAAMDLELERYSFERINGFILQRKRIEDLFNCLISRKKDERRGMKGLEAGREDIIVTGVLILLEAMSILDFGQVVVSDHGLREGIIIDRLQKLGLSD